MITNRLLIVVGMFVGLFAAISACSDAKDYGEVAADSIEQMQQAGMTAPSSGDTMSIMQYRFNIGVDTVRTVRNDVLKLDGADREYVFIIDDQSLRVTVPARDSSVQVDVRSWEPGTYRFRAVTESGEVDSGVIAVE